MSSERPNRRSSDRGAHACRPLETSTQKVLACGVMVGAKPLHCPLSRSRGRLHSLCRWARAISRPPWRRVPTPCVHWSTSPIDRASQ